MAWCSAKGLVAVAGGVSRRGPLLSALVLAVLGGRAALEVWRALHMATAVVAVPAPEAVPAQPRIDADVAAIASRHLFGAAQQSYRVGDRLPRGVELTGVEADHVLLRRGGRIETLALPRVPLQRLPAGAERHRR